MTFLIGTGIRTSMESGIGLGFFEGVWDASLSRNSANTNKPKKWYCVTHRVTPSNNSFSLIKSYRALKRRAIFLLLSASCEYVKAKCQLNFPNL